MRIRIVTAGGTIDKEYFDALSAYEVGAPQAPALLAEANARFEHVVQPAFRKDSLAMDDADRAALRAIVAAAPERMVVVTHGTDTMAESGRALAGIPEKTIVLTGAMQPARFRASDALFNLGTAVAAAQLAPPGVYIAMNGVVHRADAVRKNRAAGSFEPVDPPAG